MDLRIRKITGLAVLVALTMLLAFCLVTGRFRGSWEMSVEPDGNGTVISIFWGGLSNRPRYRVILRGDGFVDTVPRSDRARLRAPARAIMWDESMLPGRLVVEVSNAVLDIKELGLDVYRSEQSFRDLDPILSLLPDESGVVVIEAGPIGNSTDPMNSSIAPVEEAMPNP